MELLLQDVRYAVDGAGPRVILARWLPARRATSIHPLEALREN